MRISIFRTGLLLLAVVLPITPALSQSFFQPEPMVMAGFGESVAVGAGMILVGEAGGFKHPGTVHIHVKDSDGTWGRQYFLQAPEALVDDGFGQVMAFDGSTLAVGSHSEVFMYGWDASSGSFTPTGRLEHSPTALSVDGDHLVVGSGRSERGDGAVHVYHRGGDGAGWQPAAFFAGPRDGEVFGAAVVVHGTRMAVGTARGNHVAVYEYADGTWSLDVELDGNDHDMQATFGSAVDMRGSRLLIGAPSTGTTFSGMALLLEQDGEGSWAQSAVLNYPAPEGFVAGPRSFVGFGAAVKLMEDTAWLGAPGADQRSGQIYEYTYGQEGLIEVLSGMPPGIGVGGSFDTDGSVATIGLPRTAYGEGSALVLENQEGWSVAADLFNAGEPMTAVLDASELCDDGQALGYECAQVDLVSFLPLGDMEAARGVRLSDVWGWTDPESGSEYALVGHLEGAVFVDISNPLIPVYLGTLPRTEGSPGSTWRDIKVYQNHAYIVADGAGAHGMQVFDLTQLRDLENVPTQFTATAHYDQIHSAHNIVINEATGYAYAVGSSGGGETCGGGLHMIDIREPSKPTFAGCFADETTGRRNTGYSHDAQCVIYHGPDADYQGHEICVGSNETAISISDVTDKTNPIAVGTGTYPDAAYVHQGWLSEDHGWFYQNDELDELSGRADLTRTLVWDVRDLEDPQMVNEFFGPTSATDHNLYVHGNLMYQTNNASGLRVIDITTPDSPVEVGFFDTTPYGTDESGFNGTWSSYPYFESGIIVVTSRREGLFILRNQSVDT